MMPGGTTPDGYAVHTWPRSTQPGLVVRVTYPPGGRYRAIASHADDQAEAERWAEAQIAAERARRAEGAA